MNGDIENNFVVIILRCKRWFNLTSTDNVAYFSKVISTFMTHIPVICMYRLRLSTCIIVCDCNKIDRKGRAMKVVNKMIMELQIEKSAKVHLPSPEVIG